MQKQNGNTSNPDSRRFMLYGGGILIVIAAIIIALLAGGGDDTNDDNGSSGTGGASSGQGESASNPVTILVVDDFGDHMAPLVVTLFERNEEAFRQAYAGIQEIDLDPGSDEYQEEFETILSSLFEEVGEEAYALVQEIVQKDITEDNCATTPEGQGFFNTDGTGFFNTDGTGFFNTDGTGNPIITRPPHGERIEAQLNELYASHGGGAPISIVRVDTAGFSTEVIATRIEETITEILDENPDMNFVVNMSFAVVPCQELPNILIYERLMRLFDPEASDDLDALRALFADLMRSSVFQSTLNSGDQMDRWTAEVCAEDKLRDTEEGNVVCQFTEDNQILLVGAAGNGAIGASGGSPFPFFPAAWPSVVSISASDAAKDEFIAIAPRANYSNAGAVLMWGQWEHPDGFLELGTSFAAPRYSFVMAMLMSGNDLDPCSTGNTPKPPLLDNWLGGAAPSPADAPLCP